jgi:hypothetical protein
MRKEISQPLTATIRQIPKGSYIKSIIEGGVHGRK